MTRRDLPAMLASSLPRLRGERPPDTSHYAAILHETGFGRQDVIIRPSLHARLYHDTVFNAPRDAATRQPPGDDADWLASRRE